MTRCAFLGLGRMGAPMATRLAAALPTAVWNRTSGRAAEIPGAEAAATPAQAVAEADVVVTMVADGAALSAVLDGPEGVLAGIRPGTVVVDMSTIGPAAARATAARCAAAGCAFLDAPVSGSVALAGEGTLVAMVGGPAEALGRARPALAAMTRAQLHLGAQGVGAAMKLALNLALAVTNQAIAETLAIAERSGIAREQAYEVLAAGALGSPYVQYKRAAFADPEQAPVAFSVDLMRKDVALALGVAKELGVELAVGDAAADALEDVAREGYGARDLSSALTALLARD
jgi:3-hydroxyisobutyrate dehydrogenase-like beta-hydroxyacid dehydrogenase